MSFLAKLRDQQAKPEQDTRLCYVLHIEPVTRRLHLELFLSESRGGTRVYPATSYPVQRSHLERPPYFLTADDVAFIRLLVDTDPNWVGESKRKLPSVARAPLLKAIKNGTCFIMFGENKYTTVSAAEAIKTSLTWRVGMDGLQRLAWEVLPGYQLLFLSDADNAEPLVYDPVRRQVGESDHGLVPDALAVADSAPLTLAADDVAEFLVRNGTQWQELNLPLPVKVPVATVDSDVVPLLVFDSSIKNNSDTLHLVFGYQAADFGLLATTDSTQLWDGKKLYRIERNPSAENHFRQILESCLAEAGLTPSEGQGWTTDRESIWQDLLINRRDWLEENGFHIIFNKTFRYPFVSARKWSAAINESGEDGYTFSIGVEVDGQIVHLLDMLSRLRALEGFAQQKKIVLENGLILLLPKQVSELYEEIADLIAKNEVRLHRNQITRLSAIAETLPATTDWQDSLDLLKQARDICSTPLVRQNKVPGLQAELRPYQWLGVCWLQHLAARSVNGLLADDMGLGKTLQTIAHLCLEHEQGRLKQPALIVVPTSLLHNWQHELQRFAPHLSCLVLHGGDRNKHWPELKKYHVLISSYHLVVRDLEFWRAQKLSWLILDEAQVIKNRQTQVRRAVVEIPAAHRLCLSGTPVENHLGELWSIFDFLLPGCLGDYSHFREHYRKPVEEQADARRLEKLLQHIAPFMLRRTKGRIAQDLPPKTVIHQTIDMDDDQRDFYESLKKQTATDIEQQMQNADGAGTQQIILLSALTRLRQACCDPALLSAGDIQSAKRRHCIDMIRELVDEGSNLLVFSQFTRMLDLLAEDLDNHQIKYQLLTGETKNRQEKVDAFQNGEAPVFLISLKAGGVGLNLTRADTVIHFDPWWNSAAEEQASDRAHRIGQDKPVFVYKLIMEDTIEEKIVKMQERKFALGEHVNQQAELSGRQFSLKLEDLLLLWQSETQR